MDNKTLKKLQKTEIKILNEFVRICKKNNLSYVLLGGSLLGAIRHDGFIPWDDDIDVAMPRKDYDKFIKCYYKELKEEFVLDYYTVNKMYLHPFAKIRLKNTVFVERGINNFEGNNGIWLDIFPLDSGNSTKLFDIQAAITNKIRSLMFLNAGIEQDYLKKYKKFKPLISLFSNKTYGKLITFIFKIQNRKNAKWIINFAAIHTVNKKTYLKDKYFPERSHKFEDDIYSIPNDYKYVLECAYGSDYMELPPVEKRVTHNPIKIVFEDGEMVEFEKDKDSL